MTIENKKKKKCYTYNELHKIISSHLKDKHYGYIKLFCEKNKLNYAYVINCISNKSLKKPKYLVIIANALGYDIEKVKLISYKFIIK